MNTVSNANFQEQSKRDKGRMIAGVVVAAVLTIVILFVSRNTGAPMAALVSLVIAVFLCAGVLALRLAQKLERDSFEEGMYLVMEGVPMTCTITDEKGSVLHCNDHAMGLFNVSNKCEYFEKLFGDFLPEIQPDGTRSMEKAGGHIQAAFKNGRETFEWWHQMGPGKEQFPCSVTLAAASVYGMKRLLVFNSDLRPTYAMQRQEAEFKTKMNILLDTSPLLCTVHDANGNIIEVNKEAENMFGISDKQIFANNYERFLPKTQPDGSDSARRSIEMLGKCISEGSCRYEWTYLHGDGSPLPVEEITHRIQLGDQNLVIAYSRDLREYYKEREKERVVQGKIQDMLEQLNDHVEEQTSSIAASSSATEEMIANIRSVTDTLSSNTKNVKELQDASVVGHSSLSEVAGDIQGIARESESLLEINAVMQNIASQTNLLSMNAAIEAAHAGESGRGFAVVADEIRKLAESSSKQSKTIGGVLKSIKGAIDKITKSTGAVLDRFNAIEDGVKTVAEQEDNILRAMEEQGQGSKQILQAVSNVNEVTHQVREAARRMVETSKEAMHKTDNTETQASIDQVTGVRNKTYFQEAAALELRYCIDEEREFNVIMLGIDNLRQLVGDNGDGVKDEVLKILAQRTRNVLKQGTLLARYGDGELVITLPNVSRGTAVKLAEQIQKNIRANLFATRGRRLDVRVSLGLASKSASGKTLSDIAGNAEKALSSARAGGGNKMATFE